MAPQVPTDQQSALKRYRSQHLVAFGSLESQRVLKALQDVHASLAGICGGNHAARPRERLGGLESGFRIFRFLGGLEYGLRLKVFMAHYVYVSQKVDSGYVPLFNSAGLQCVSEP